VLEVRPISHAMQIGGVQLVFNTTEGATAPGRLRSLRRAALLHKSRLQTPTRLSGGRRRSQGIKAYLLGDFEVRALQSYFGVRQGRIPETGAAALR